MKQQDVEKIFAEINKLYDEYHDISLRKNDTDFSFRYSAAYKSAREKLIISVCKLYFKFEYREDSNDKTHVVTVKNKNNDNYSDVILEATINAMDSYEESGGKEKGILFSQFVCLKIKQTKGKEKSKTIISSNHGGRTVSDYESNMVRRVMKKDAELEKFGIFDENKRNEKIALLLSTDTHIISIESVIHFKKLSKNQTIGTEQASPHGDEYSILDIEKNLNEKNYITPESEMIKRELSCQLNILLSEIDSMKYDTKESEIFTIALLKAFQLEKEEYIKKFGSLEKFNFSIYSLLSRHKCIESIILDSFFNDPNYKLPTQNDIENKYGLSEKYGGKLLQRFRETIAANKKVRDYFYDFIKEK